MKKNKKCIVFIMAVLMVTLLVGCGKNSSSGTASNTGSNMSEDAGADTELSVTEDSDTDADHEDLWNPLNAATIDGQTVSYGPITIILPDGYEVDGETEASSTPRFLAKDREDQGVTPTIAFQMLPMAEYSSDPEANKAAYLEGIQEGFSGNENAEVEEVISYNESIVGEYKAIKCVAKADIAGMSAVMGSYMIFEKTEGTGECVSIMYIGLESDTEGLAAFEESLEGISERTDTSDIVSGAVTPVSDWQSAFAGGSGLAVDGNSVTYGPLQMKLPDGYAVEDETAESPMLYNADRTGCFSFIFEEDSYDTMSDRDYMENKIKEEYEGGGMTDVSLDYHEKVSIDGYDGYEIGVKYTVNGVKMIQYYTSVFESTDELSAPMITVSFITNEENVLNVEEEVDAAFESIRLAGE